MKNKTMTTGLSSIKAKLKARAKIDSNTANQDESMTNNSASKANLYGEETFKTTDLIDKPIIFAEAIGQVKPLINDTVRLISKSHKTNREQKKWPSDYNVK
jgi:hypothetical protein